MDRLLQQYPVSLSHLLELVGLPESSYFFEPKGTKGGKTASDYTLKKDEKCSEEQVVNSINGWLSHEFIDCGYHLITGYLKKEGYQINHKKVYRIMKKQGLLKRKNRIDRSGSGRKFVKFRKVKTSRPLECLEMDIKMIWIPSVGKNAYLLSVIDVHTRVILGDYFAFSIKQHQVIALLSRILDSLEFPANVVIRSDNGSQFIASNVREYLSLLGVEQEFTHVATPEENAHIESYHGILKREVLSRYEYHNFGEIEAILKRWTKFYNHERLHGLLGKITPMEKWEMDKHLILKRRHQQSA